MGRGNRNVNRFAQRKRDLKEKAKNQEANKKDDRRKPYQEIVRENAQFEQYYKAQNICPAEEWQVFMETYKKDLPSSFRIASYPWEEAQTLQKIIQSEYFSQLINIKKDDGSNEEIKPNTLPWYPNELAWQVELSRTDIRRSEPLYRLHNFLVAETATGCISRQETVSMIPPLLLDISGHHKILDMCASPGSKTVQILETLHSKGGIKAGGLVVANDLDNNRCYMLIHQTKRLNSPCLVITNQDAAALPNMVISDDKKAGACKPLRFSRVLCDVPCSGDGTLRKNPDIWQKWNPAHANHLHGVQYRILRRGLELLECGGRLVYSTCSLNPVEDEAVVHRALREAGDSVRLLDVAGQLPGLKYQAGVSTWRLAANDMVFFDKPEDVPQNWSTVVRSYMFPPSPEDAPKYHLDKCIRILPHYQNTGGFFIAVFEKVDELPWQKSAAESEKTTGESNNDKDKTNDKEDKTNDKEDKTNDKEDKTNDKEDKERIIEPPRKRRRMDGYREDPFVFFTKDDEEKFYAPIKEFYDISSDFDTSCLLTRCHVGKKNNIYMVSPSVRDFVRLNESRIKIINVGVKTFVRCDSRHMTCAFRLAQDGLHCLLPHIGPGRRVRVPRDDLVYMLEHNKETDPPRVEVYSEPTRAQVKDFATGSCVLIYEDKESPFKLAQIGWRGAFSLRAYSSRADTVHYLRLLGADVSKFEVNKFKKADAADAADAEQSEPSEPVPMESADDLESPTSETRNGDTESDEKGEVKSEEKIELKSEEK